MSNRRDRHTFAAAYAGKAPWDIGKPQGAIAESVDLVTSPVLDAGCGTGENALFLAARGHRVIGIDFVDEAIRMARRKAAERGLTAEFRVKDALTLSDWDQRFATVIDSGLFHVLSDEDRARYVAGLTHVTQPGGRLLLLCFSDEEPGTQGPRRVSQREIRAAFGDPWTVEEIRARRADVRRDLQDVSFSEGGPKVWFAIVGRNK
ncbi:MAG: class I SAM-dependent methyltransferase [Bryobacteraceae bacterium]|jgi:cyclopropane fatty-acyl-phospholipid synthase-like methyltransferase